MGATQESATGNYSTGRLGKYILDFYMQVKLSMKKMFLLHLVKT